MYGFTSSFVVKVFMSVFHFGEQALGKIYRHNNLALHKIPSILFAVLQQQKEDHDVMEQWLLLVYHLCKASNLGLAGMREAAHGNIAPVIHKVGVLHSHSAYMRALVELVLEEIAHDD